MSKEAEILRKCVSCHDERTCQNQGNRGGSCISSVSVLQNKTTANVARPQNICTIPIHIFLQEIKQISDFLLIS